MSNKNTQRIKIKRIENGLSKTVFDTVAIEKEIILKIATRSEFRFLCTPNDLKALAIGFLFTQGMIKNIQDIKKLNCAKNYVAVELRKNTKPQIAHPPKKPFVFSAPLIFKLMADLQKKQKIFPLTGGSHAALIFNAKGQGIAFAEDVARHNAIDKAIGKCLLNKTINDAYGIILSSRVTFELVKKIAAANLKLIACVSAPSSLAIQTAKKFGITLCGFVRGEKSNVYVN